MEPVGRGACCVRSLWGPVEQPSWSICISPSSVLLHSALRIEVFPGPRYFLRRMIWPSDFPAMSGKPNMVKSEVKIKVTSKRGSLLEVRFLQFVPQEHRLQTPGGTKTLAQPCRHSRGATQPWGNGCVRALAWPLGPACSAWWLPCYRLGWNRENCSLVFDSSTLCDTL